MAAVSGPRRSPCTCDRPDVFVEQHVAVAVATDRHAAQRSPGGMSPVKLAVSPRQASRHWRGRRWRQ